MPRKPWELDRGAWQRDEVPLPRSLGNTGGLEGSAPTLLQSRGLAALNGAQSLGGPSELQNHNLCNQREGDEAPAKFPELLLHEQHQQASWGRMKVDTIQILQQG